MFLQNPTWTLVSHGRQSRYRRPDFVQRTPAGILIVPFGKLAGGPLKIDSKLS